MVTALRCSLQHVLVLLLCAPISLNRSVRFINVSIMPADITAHAFAHHDIVAVWMIIR